MKILLSCVFAACLSCSYKPVYAADASLIVDIIECESSGRHNVYGDKGKSYGLVQFQEATFNEFKRKAHMRKLQWRNPVHQLRLMIWMIDHGYGGRWTCYRKLNGPH